MTIDDALTAEVTRAEALHELALHGADPALFFAEVGDRDTYGGDEVLYWLGY